jgi:TolB-like protein/Tfp pilus assembly protein PilF
VNDHATVNGIERPSRVFLSYSRTDRESARIVADALRESGLDVWWDAHIEGGAAFAKAIEAALQSSDAVVVLWSANSLQSDWVLDEAAQGRDQKKLVPVSLDGSEPPLGFRQYQSIPVRIRRGRLDDESLQSVLRAVLPLAGREALPLARPAPGRADEGRRRVLVAGAGALVAAAGVGVFGWRRGWFGAPAPTGGDRSVAVMPFENLSGDAQKSYFSEGLSEELRATLARNQRLKVMAKTSSSLFRDSTESAVQIAGQLGVAFLLHGSVRWAGNDVRVAVDLVDGGSGFTRWAHTFERRIDDVFAVQEEIANTVAAAMAAEVTSPGTPDAQRAASGGTVDVVAFDTYLRGRAMYETGDDEASERRALDLFDEALARDPTYAAAYASRAATLTTLANQYAEVDKHDAMYDQAVAAARRAVALAPAYAGGHSMLGFVLFQGRLDARAARVPYEESNRLGPGDATVQARWAQYCARTGRAREASEAIERAVSRDRLNALIHRAAGTIAYAARRYEDSLPPLRKALQMSPQMGRAHAFIGDALVNLGKLDDARAAYALEPGEDFRLAGLAIAEHRAGNATAAKAAMDQLVSERGDAVLYQQCQVLAQWGELDAAMKQLQAARKLGDSGLIYARNDPFLDPLRKDPRMTALLDSLGFDAAL